MDEGEQLLAQLLWGHRAVDEGGDGEVDLVLALEAILRRAARFSGHGACFCEQLPQPLPRLLADVSIAGEATGHQVEEASMFGGVRAFSSFAVDDSAAASKFYGEMLGLRVCPRRAARSWLHLAGDHPILVYPRFDHSPASFTVLNFPVDEIDQAVDELTARGVSILRYEGFESDDKGIHRGQGRLIAWFTDPAGNVLSVVQEG